VYIILTLKRVKFYFFNSNLICFISFQVILNQPKTSDLKYFFVSESFIEKIRSKTLINSVMIQLKSL